MTMPRLYEVDFEVKEAKTKIKNRGMDCLSKIGSERVRIGSGHLQGVEPQPYEAKIDPNSNQYGPDNISGSIFFFRIGLVYKPVYYNISHTWCPLWGRWIGHT